MSQNRSNRPRVLHIFFSLTTGGTERLITDLVLGLADFGFRVSVGTFRTGPFAETISQAGGDVTVLGTPNIQPRLARMIVHFGRLRSLLASGFDIVHTHNLGILWRVLAASSPRRSWRWVHTEHIRVDVPDVYSPRLLKLAPILLRRPDLITGVSKSTCAYYANVAGIASDRVRHVPNGVDLRRFAMPGDRLAARRRLGIPSDAWLIGMVANLRPEKNHVALLKALVGVRRMVPSARLLLAGEGPLLRKLQDYAQHLGVASFVHFLGARTDVPDILCTLDVYCLPSRFEGMPFSLLEAMAAGCPVVATDAPGTVDVVEHASTGLLAPVDDTEKLTEQLLRVHDDPLLRAALIDAARRYVAAHASRDAMLVRYAEIYTLLHGVEAGTPRPRMPS